MNHQGNMPPQYRHNPGGGHPSMMGPPPSSYGSSHASDGGMHSSHMSDMHGQHGMQRGGNQASYSQSMSMQHSSSATHASSTSGQINQSSPNLALSAGLSSDKSARSIFVGNIPYEATEEKLIDLFSQAGPVVSFRLVFDRESGKPKGYGFCEYADVTVANSALRNLHNIEFNGRPLRIGPAAGEQNSAEVAMFTSAPVGPPQETPYGDPVDPKEAPEAISRAVASLPPEQMFDLMVQMKHCVQRNPAEARNMLLQNPQLAYALLQAQIVMKIVDPKVAIALLNRGNEPVAPLSAPPNVANPVSAPTVSHKSLPVNAQPSLPMQGSGPQPVPPVQAVPRGESTQPRPGYSMNPPMPPTRTQPSDSYQQHTQRMQQPYASTAVSSSVPRSSGSSNPISAATNFLNSGTDQDKAALVMQVLQLSDEQIAMLPEDQRRSIMILKEQIGAGSIRPI